MTEQSDRMLILLQELAALKEMEEQGGNADTASHRKRKREITKEMKQLAAERKSRSSS